jgi:hypothetical protein
MGLGSESQGRRSLAPDASSAERQGDGVTERESRAAGAFRF